jgi:hypothetical protein
MGRKVRSKKHIRTKRKLRSKKHIRSKRKMQRKSLKRVNTRRKFIRKKNIRKKKYGGVGRTPTPTQADMELRQYSPPTGANTVVVDSTEARGLKQQSPQPTFPQAEMNSSQGLTALRGAPRAPDAVIQHKFWQGTQQYPSVKVLSKNNTGLTLPDGW